MMNQILITNMMTKIITYKYPNPALCDPYINTPKHKVAPQTTVEALSVIFNTLL